MSSVPFLMMAKNQQKKSSSNKNNKSNNNHDKNYSDNYGRRENYTIENYTFYLFMNDKIVRSFFTKLNDIAKKIDELDKKECLDEFVDMSNIYFSLVEKTNDIMDELEKDGLNLSLKFRTKIHSYPVMVGHGLGFKGLDIGYNKGAPFGCCFNGVRITEQMILSDDINIYEEEYKDWEYQNSNIFFEEKWLEDVISMKKQKMRLSVFNRKEKEEEIKKLENQLDEIKVRIEEGRQIKKCAEFFDSLTNSQKTKMLSYFKYVNECEKIGKKIEELIDKVISISATYSSNDRFFAERDKLNRAYKLLLESGDDSLIEEMKYVNNLILDASNQKSVDGISSSRVNDYSFIKLLSWYTAKVISENKVNIVEETQGKLRKK